MSRAYGVCTADYVLTFKTNFPSHPTVRLRLYTHIKKHVNLNICTRFDALLPDYVTRTSTACGGGAAGGGLTSMDTSTKVWARACINVVIDEHTMLKPRKRGSFGVFRRMNKQKHNKLHLSWVVKRISPAKKKNQKQPH